MEIKKNELRIGNIVSWNGEIAVISQLLERDISFKCGEECLYEDIKPIPLTEEVLLRCGCIKVNNSTFRKGAFTFQPQSFSEGKDIVEKIFNSRKVMRICLAGKFLVNLEYLHQFQNLYHVLSGKELTYNHSPSI